jgi:hypothetical protein
VDAIGSDCQRNIGAGVDEQGGFQFSVLSSQFGHDSCCFSGQGLQIASGKIFFAELDVVDAGAGGFLDFFQEAATAGEFVSGERGAVGDVIEKAALGHRVKNYNHEGH